MVDGEHWKENTRVVIRLSTREEPIEARTKDRTGNYANGNISISCKTGLENSKESISRADSDTNISIQNIATDKLISTGLERAPSPSTDGK